MADDLRDALHGLYATHESTAAATPAGPALALATVSRKARRRRAARTAGTGAVVVALVGAVSVGAAAARTTWWTPQPAATGTATVTPSPTPSPTPSSSGTADDEPAAVTSSPFLPAAEPMPDGFLAQTDLTWNLVTYASHDGSHPAVLYLVGPEGRLVEVPSPVAGTLVAGDESGPRIAGWLPGTTRVLVRTASGIGDSAAIQVLDLLSGEPSATFEGAGAVYPTVGFVGDGTTDVLVEVWSPEGDTVTGLYRATADGQVRAELADLPGSTGGPTDVVVDAAGTRVALLEPTGVRVLDTATMQEVWSVAAMGVGACYQGAWDAAGRLIVACSPQDGGDAHYWLLAEASAPRLLGTAGRDGLVPPGESLRPVLHLGDLTAFGDGTAGDLGIAMWLLEADGTLSALPGIPEADGCTDVAVAGRFTCQITTHSGPEVEGAHDQLVSLDPLTGDRTVLLDVVDPARSRLGLVPIAW